MSALTISAVKKEYEPTTLSVFDSPECSNEDTNSSSIGTSKVIVTDTLSIEIAVVFDGHGGKEASAFLKEHFISCFISSIAPESFSKDLLQKCLDSIASDNGSDVLYQTIIDNGVIATDVELCKHLRTLKLSRDPGSTMSAWVNFITPTGNDSYLVNVGDSPAYAVCRDTGVITSAILHDIKDSHCQSEAEKLPHVSIITRRNNRRIMDICIRAPTICEMIPSATMMYMNGVRALNIPRSLGHIRWNTSINKHPEITKVPDDADTVVLMTDGVSDMIVDEEEYLKKSEELEWNVDEIGSFYRDRWYQPWNQLCNGYVSTEKAYIAIKGDKLHVSDDMTIVQVKIGKI
jgi:serine/threonine protein phosphatase PrpC